MSIDIGIPEKNRKAIATGLSRLLADSYTLYLKTHNYHWNVTGPMFNSLHLMFETQYNELALAVDEIAERIRSIGHYAPGSYSEFAELSTVKEASGRPNAQDMLRHLADDQALVSSAAKKLIDVATEAGDDVSVDMGVRRMEVHQKNEWMLRSHLE